MRANKSGRRGSLTGLSNARRGSMLNVLDTVGSVLPFLPSSLGNRKRDAMNCYIEELIAMNMLVHELQYKQFQLGRKIDKEMQQKLKQKMDTRAAALMEKYLETTGASGAALVKGTKSSLAFVENMLFGKETTEKFGQDFIVQSIVDIRVETEQKYKAAAAAKDAQRRNTPGGVSFSDSLSSGDAAGDGAVVNPMMMSQEGEGGTAAAFSTPVADRRPTASSQTSEDRAAAAGPDGTVNPIHAATTRGGSNSGSASTNNSRNGSGAFSPRFEALDLSATQVKAVEAIEQTGESAINTAKASRRIARRAWEQTKLAGR